ncbi:hypothetical protein DPMN_165425 [Dreissena polymorpha]|uniref:Uncharacterized protein n=1 Tax=Dreissena polymorpha TaxID=45954 RepID=A0A9D4EX56_DREPO|nr:hypothetical protein DPMN_165425 [Dreissena polymorpha]
MVSCPTFASLSTRPFYLSLRVVSGTEYILAALYAETPPKVASNALCRLSLSYRRRCFLVEVPEK